MAVYSPLSSENIKKQSFNKSSFNLKDQIFGEHISFELELPEQHAYKTGKGETLSQKGCLQIHQIPKVQNNETM